jgi:hypothetical protein
MLVDRSTIVILAFLSVSLAARAEPATLDLEAPEAARLIGAPVIVDDGTKVGEVADIILDEYGLPQRVRVTMPAPLGFGERTVEIPRNAYIMRSGRVVLLDLAAEHVRGLPDVTDVEVEK